MHEHRPPIPENSQAKTQQGIALLEALIAIVIFSIAVLALLGLQATMIANTSSAKYRADASYIAQQRIGTMWADPNNLDSYVVANLSVAQLPGGLLTVTTPVNGQFTVTVGWTAPDETAAADDNAEPCHMRVAHCYRTTASIAGG